MDTLLGPGVALGEPEMTRTVHLTPAPAEPTTAAPARVFNRPAGAPEAGTWAWWRWLLRPTAPPA